MNYSVARPSHRGVVATLAMVCLSLAASASCTTPLEKLKYAHLGMSQEDVTTNIGRPAVVRGTVVNRFGQEVEVWEYRLVYPDHSDTETFKIVFSTLTFGAGSPVWLVQNTQPFWFYFVDSRLARWSEAGDWEAEKERLYELPWKVLEPLGPG